MENLLSSGKHADVVLRCRIDLDDPNQVEDFPAHKCIIICKRSDVFTVIIEAGNVDAFVFSSAKSPVFDAMFAHDMKEGRDNAVKIDDISAEVMGRVLHFIYTEDKARLTALDYAGLVDLLEGANKVRLADAIGPMASCRCAVQRFSSIQDLFLYQQYDVAPLRAACESFLRYHWYLILKQFCI